MSLSRVVEESADLRKMPKARARLTDEPTQHTIGDLHGNAMKLIYMLIREGVIELEEGADDYQQLFDIYNKDPSELTKKDLKQFQGLLEFIKISNPEATIQLIGDELGDRGSNDYFTLLVLKALQDKNVDFNVVLSNHTAAFLEVYTDKETLANPEIKTINYEYDGDEYSEVTAYDTKLTGFYQDRSLQGLGHLISNGVVSVSDTDDNDALPSVESLVREVYTPHFNLVNYSIDPDSNNITLYAHNLIGLDTIVELAQHYDIEHNGQAVNDFSSMDNIQDVASIINQINAAFRATVLDPKTGDFKDNDSVMDEVESSAIHRVIWERKVPSPTLGPIEGKGFSVSAVHGHQGEDYPSFTHSSNTDTNFGKLNNVSGTYKCHVTTEMPSYTLQQRQAAQKKAKKMRVPDTPVQPAVPFDPSFQASAAAAAKSSGSSKEREPAVAAEKKYPTLSADEFAKLQQETRSQQKTRFNAMSEGELKKLAQQAGLRAPQNDGIFAQNDPHEYLAARVQLRKMGMESLAIDYKEGQHLALGKAILKHLQKADVETYDKAVDCLFKAQPLDLLEKAIKEHKTPGVGRVLGVLDKKLYQAQVEAKKKPSQ